MTLRSSGPVLLVFAVFFSTACDVLDRVVGPGEALTIGNNAGFVGSAGDAATPPNPGIRVDGGSLTVGHARVRGGALNVLAAMLPAPEPFPGRFIPSGGPGVRVVGGSVRLTSGARVTGGDASIDDPQALRVGAGAGIVASRAIVTVEDGATVMAGGFRLPMGSTDPVPPLGLLPGTGINIINGRLTVSGGQVLGGLLPAQAGFPLGSDRTVGIQAIGSEVAISGGESSGINLGGATLRMTGGTLGSAGVVGGCFELRGGSVSTVLISSGQLLVFGTDFDRPLGPVAVPEGGLVEIGGTLESGEPLALLVLTVRSVSIDDELPPLQVILAEPGGPGCPLQPGPAPIPIPPL